MVGGGQWWQTARIIARYVPRLRRKQRGGPCNEADTNSSAHGRTFRLWSSRASPLLLLLLLSLSLLHQPAHGSEQGDQRLPPCHSSELSFLGKCFCKPGYFRLAGAKGSSNEHSATCSEPLLQHGDCDCHPELTELQQREAFLLDQKWSHKKGYRCTALCRYSAEAGVITSIDQEWHENQVWRQMPFYKQELTQTSQDSKARTHMRIRLEEFHEGFRGFQGLNGTHLGRVVEFGAGGYTQTRNLLERTTATMDSVVLVDPMVRLSFVFVGLLVLVLVLVLLSLALTSSSY